MKKFVQEFKAFITRGNDRLTGAFYRACRELGLLENHPT